MWVYTLINIIVLLLIIFLLYFMEKKHLNFTVRVLSALILGLLLGFVLRNIYAQNTDVITNTMIWYNVVGSGYVRLLQMLVMPLIFISITMALLNIKGDSNIAKMTMIIIAILMITTAISALVGILISKGFGLDASKIQAIVGDYSQGALNYENRLEAFNSKPVPQQLLEIIPTNPFSALAGGGGSPTLSVVFFSAFVGMAALGIKKKKPEVFDFFRKIMFSLHEIVMRIVSIVMRLTPYGVLALMAKFMATSDLKAFAQLGQFLLASYIAIFIMLIVHSVILIIFGYNPVKYYSKALPTLAFAFSSRTSAGTLPMTVDTLKNKMGISEGVSNLSASLAVTIGQNGCAGIYPAMVVAMIAPTLGINVFEPVFLIKVVIIIAIGSFGIAGVGGGATNAALITLSALNFPVELVAILLGIEPLIDMGRTLLNVNDGMITAAATGKICKEVDMNKFNTNDTAASENS
ncbi:sodium:dicarboxylate symporter [Brachyspira pilosicoli WesB]|nr:cation:dicarboxylase symporter family transporter [Brachyspira pilosicoli]AGA66980.1 sodium:dicarboxylate symporter [Brachyspira pilosicoli P43/6/78]PLV55255.1 L-cystine transporter tcyP [Brachyspira pilosicoli SP16]WIH80778.1 cation:dicarboxylase symporter family transporter [Brachyspira pilosicoli]WIH82988.1 cation:dicarboxylase symporter family transporter [Brachyspira pilosicoli]WIH85220.1 cation:dicarboxylase symporter family transporter [Brachyspira pilosicoli]